MLTPEEAAELRRLQARAYAPDGGISDPDAERLHALEQRRIAPAPDARADAATEPVEANTLAELAEASPFSLAEPVDAPSLSLAEPVEASSSPPAEPVEAPPPTRGLRAFLRHRFFPYAASALALALGIGIGWLVFARGAEHIALSADTAAKQAELETGGRFDPGSIQPLGERYGATIWEATADDGAARCVIITHGEDQGSQCAPLEDFETTGVFASVTPSDEESGATVQISAAIGPQLGGGTAAIVQKYDMDETWDWRSQYSEAELAIVDQLEEQGYDGAMLQIVGYDGDTPVWMQWTGEGNCVMVVVSDGVTEACADAMTDPVSLTVNDADGATTTYLLTQTEMRGPLLTIERGAPVSLDDKTGEAEGD
ncbi:hypothetical protein ACWGJP_01830 [Microbacterium sp. NPDC055903]